MSNSSDNVWISDSAIPDFEAGTKVFFKVFAETKGIINRNIQFYV